MARRRQKLKKGYSKRLFTKTASRTNKRNLRVNPMRGGLRI